MQISKTESGTLPTIGVVILNYNYARFVTQAIESVLAQTLPFDEIFVVDDGSTDNSVEVISRYVPRVTLISKANGGMMSASIAGLQRVTAEYVYILDADDYVSPHLVEKLRPYLMGRPVKANWQLIGVDSAGNEIDCIFPTYPPGYDTGQMLEDNKSNGFYLCGPQTGNIYRRDYLQKLDLASIHPHQPVDGAPNLIAPYFGTVVAISEPLAYYRSHTSSMSSWSNPTQELFAREVDIFRLQWRDGCRLSGKDRPPFCDEEPLYILERRLLTPGLVGKNPGFQTVRSFQRRVLQTHFPTQHKWALFLWAALFLVPSASFRRYLVLTRRSARGRSRMLRIIVRFLRAKERNGSMPSSVPAAH